MERVVKGLIEKAALAWVPAFVGVKHGSLEVCGLTLIGEFNMGLEIKAKKRRTNKTKTKQKSSSYITPKSREKQKNKFKKNNPKAELNCLRKWGSFFKISKQIGLL